MARARDPNRDLAFELYKQHDGKILLKDIAAQLGKSEGTIRGWKNKDNWDSKIDGTLQSNKRNAPNKKEQNKTKKEVIVENEVEHGEDDGLTEKQRLFCLYYVQTLNATSAYKKAYQCSYVTAMSEGSKLTRNPKIKHKIAELKKERLEEENITKDDILRMYKAIAFADITDFIDFSQVESEFTEEVTTIDKEGKTTRTLRTEPYTYTKFAMHHSENVDGTIITELSRGKDGQFKVKLADKMAALNFLARYTDLLNENELHQLKVEQTKLEISKLGEVEEEKPIEILIKRKESRD